MKIRNTGVIAVVVVLIMVVAVVSFKAGATFTRVEQQNAEIEFLKRDAQTAAQGAIPSPTPLHGILPNSMVDTVHEMLGLPTPQR